MKRSKRGRRVLVSADRSGVVSHAGVGLLRELAEGSGLVEAVTAALVDTYKGTPVHPPGRVFADLAVAIADGADAISGIAVLRDRQDLHGPVASMPTTWRVLDRIGPGQLDRLAVARAKARTAAWAAGAGPDLSKELIIDVDATIVIAHSEKQNAAATWKRTFGFHPLLAFLDRPEVAAGEALAGMLRSGNAGSNTAADHIDLLDAAIAGLPEHARPGKQESARLLVRSDSAGATHAFAAACRDRGVGFSFGFGVDERIERIVGFLPEQCWMPALEGEESIRDGAQVAEITELIDLSPWPEGSRLILRRERPHPGAQLTLHNTDAAGRRITAFLTDTGPGVVAGQAAGLELRHRRHARVEDRIRGAKNTGLRNLPCRAWNENAAWLQAVLTAIDLVCWAKLLCFTDIPDLARCEISAFRYRVLHVAARLTQSARRTRLHIDQTWTWAPAIATGWARLRAAFP